MDEREQKFDRSVIGDHRRQWRDCLYVYPVVSRRSGGLSVGVNLNPNRQCTFGCVYCQIDRSSPRRLDFVDLEVLTVELQTVLAEVASGAIWTDPRFAATPARMRRIHDIAFSGDGEPTCHPEFDRAVAIARDARGEMDLPEVKLVVITNSTGLSRPAFRRALPILSAAGGQIWAKLDAGSEAYFQRINRPAPGITLDQIVAEITTVAREMPVVLQTLLMALNGRPASPAEIEAYIGRVRQILDAGGRIELIQLHTIARSPAEAYVRYLPEAQLRILASRIAQALPEVPVEVYPGRDVEPMGSGPTRPAR
jgi:wyosine [tRNA(Phe)-imidazoG37] synthetase (radical SAM superfamily)